MIRRSSGSLGRRVRRADATTPAARKPSTKELLINVGEQLFGRFGIDAVSLREISATAGQTNPNAVQYHFKDKRGLVLAIVNDRFHRAEARRREQLEALRNSESSSAARDVLRILWDSVMAIRGSDGQYSFCRFLLQFLLQPHGSDHPAEDLASYRRSTNVPVEFASILAWNRLLRGSYPALTAAQFEYRLRALAMMFLAAVIQHDNAQLLVRSGKHDEFDLEPILDLAIAALSAPLAKRSPASHKPR